MGGRRPVVLVFMGGESAEHDVSLRSGAAVARNLPEAGFEPVPVVVTREGRYAFPPAEDLGRVDGAVDLGDAVNRIRDLSPACAFIAMHGPYGEDGRVQALCDLMHVPYVGSDVTGSAVAMDKWLAKSVYRSAGIPTPQAVLVDRRAFVEAPDRVLDEIERTLGLPCIVKTTRLGSSVGVGVAHDRDALGSWIDEALQYGGAFCEAYHPGRELTVPVLEDPDTGEPAALPVIEIVVKGPSRFFDYTSKYDPALADEVCPALIPDDLAREVRDLAIQAHRALMLRGFSRTDFLVDDRGVWTLETNTIPGLTEVSLFPKAARVAGMTFADLVRVLVQGAMRGQNGRPPPPRFTGTVGIRKRA